MQFTKIKIKINLKDTLAAIRGRSRETSSEPIPVL